MNVTKLFQQVKNVALKASKKAKLPNNGASITGKFTKATGLKVLGALATANIVDDEIQKVPFIDGIYDWWATVVDKIYGATTDKIPGVGDFLKYLRDGLNRLVIPNAQAAIEKERDNMAKNKKKVNHPSFYQHLDMHKAFSIPGAYTKKTMVNGTMGTPKLAVHRVNENPVPDKSAVIDRCNQKYSLIKAVRGLSATVYNIIDLYNYERFAKLNLLMYFTVKKVVQAAKTYSLVQTSVGDNIIKAYGFDPTEVRTNLANYETLLCQIHRFISNNLPISGTWIDRLDYLVGANVPDYSDAKVATVHMFAVSINSVFYDVANPTSKFVFDAIPDASNNSYTVIAANFATYQQAIVANDRWQQLIADYFGAFGSQCIWSDKSYPEYKDPLNLANGDNDLNREQIKNALYLNARLTLITINAGVPNKKLTIDLDDMEPFQYNSYQFPGTYDATSSAATALNYANILDGDSYLQGKYASTQPFNIGNDNRILIPDMNGVGAQTGSVTNTTAYVNMSNHETIYTLHKDNYSEEESLEISQFKARCIGMSYVIDENTETVGIRTAYKTQEYAILDTVVYTFHDYGSGIIDFTFRIMNEAICDDDLTDVESGIDFPEEIMAWALIDWMPLAHFTFFGFISSSATYFPRDIALIDMDAFGSLDDRAFATSINYSIYSLLATNLHIGNKRVDNLGQVYKNKANTKA